MTEEKPETIRPYMTAQQVARLFQVTPRTVTRWAEQGEIPGFKVGDVWRFDRDEIEAHIRRQRAAKPSKEE
jgi:excisionase family DNA binding protein